MLKKALAALFVAAACAASAAAAPTLRVGLEPTFQPFEFVDSHTKQYVGYDIDMVRAAAKHAGYDVKISNMGFDGLIPALMTGNIDVIASGMTITEERAKKVSFTKPVYRSSQVLLINKSSAKSVKSEKDLQGKDVCVQIGTIVADKAKEIPGAKVKNFNTVPDAYLELRNHGCTAVLLDTPVIEYFLKQKASRGMMEVKTSYPAEDMGFAVKKGNKKLLDALNKALDQMEKSGEAKKIHAKWFQSAK